MASKQHKSKIIINTQRLDKNIQNRRSHEKNLTPKQLVHKIHKEIRGNSQPPNNADYIGGVPTHYELKNSSVKETQEMQMQRQQLMQQYTQNQPARNVSAFNQQVKMPMEQYSAEHNFLMNQTATEFSPNKKPNSHRRQIALSPKPQIDHSFSYYTNEITDGDNPQNYKTQDNGLKSQRKPSDQYNEMDIRSKTGKGRTKTILTSLGVEQQPVQISNKIQENASKNLVNENLFQAQMNGQIKIQHDIQGLRNQGSYQTAKDQKKQQNFFQSKTGNQSEMKSPMREQSFLPSIDNTYRGNGNSLPPEVKIPQLYPGTPGKQHIKQGFNLKIGDNAEVKITINNSQTPRPEKQNEQVTKKKLKKESSSQNNRQKQIVVNHQKGLANDPLRQNKDRQLEDLNETLQRLAREKQNAINGRINLTTSRRKPNKIELIQDPKTPGYRLEVSDPYFMDEEVQEKLRIKKKQQQAEQELMNFKYKLETNNRVQPGGRLIMGDNMLVSQRLQGIKQVNIPNPKQSANESKSKRQQIQQQQQQQQIINQQQQQAPQQILQQTQYQTPQPSKIYKISKQDIQTPNGSLFERNQSSYQPSEDNKNIKNIKERGMRNIIVESQIQIPTFGPEQSFKNSRQSSPLLNSQLVDAE